MTKHGPGAWLGLAAYVAAYDYYAIKNDKETLSAAFGRSLANPVSRWPTIVVFTLLSKHLLLPHVLPQIDPFARLAEKWRNGVEDD